jgi:flagellar P-ring protein precursor FlgI
MHSRQISKSLTIDRRRAGIAARCLTLVLTVAVPVIAAPVQAAPVRLKELTNVVGVRDNALVGYGLVVGLSGTGDTERVFFTSQSVAGMLGRLGVRIDPQEVRVRNVAAVMVTATLPPFSRQGARLDVEVSSIGNARSLVGGVLLMTPLKGPDGKVYAVGQGPVQVGGYAAGAAGSRISKNQTTSGRVPEGGTVERAVTVKFTDKVTLNLKRPDFTTAVRIAKAINENVGEGSANALDPAAVEISVPKDYAGGTVAMISTLEALEVEPDTKAIIVISERTGTVVAGSLVKIRPVAVAHGGLQISVDNRPSVSQPGAFGQGNTAVVQQAQVEGFEESTEAVALPATTTVQELVAALNQLGVTPRDLIAILQAMKTAGAIDADLRVQ